MAQTFLDNILRFVKDTPYIRISWHSNQINSKIKMRNHDMWTDLKGVCLYLCVITASMALIKLSCAWTRIQWLNAKHYECACLLSYHTLLTFTFLSFRRLFVQVTYLQGWKPSNNQYWNNNLFKCCWIWFTNSTGCRRDVGRIKVWACFFGCIWLITFYLVWV